MNTDWALAELAKFIDMTVMRNGSSSSGGVTFLTSSDYTKASDAEVTQQAPVVERIVDRVIPGWRRDVPKSSANNRWSRHREAAIRARELLVRQQEIEENLGENAPALSAVEFHEWVWSGAKSLWQSGHYREAVEGAIKKLNAETQNKVGRRDASETTLFQQAFSPDAARPGKARLRRMAPDASDTYKSVQRGAMAFAEGVFGGIRNPLSHEAEYEMSQQEALEYLAALSVLARWVDGSEIERSEGGET